MITKIEKPPLDELVHFGVLGMHWGKRNSSGKADRVKQKQLKKADKDWDKNFKTHADKMMNKIMENKEVNKAGRSLAVKLSKTGLTGKALDNAYQSGIAKVMTDHLLADKESYNPSMTKVLVITTVSQSGNVYIKPVAATIKTE